MQAPSGEAHYRNTWDGLSKILRREGLPGLFRGSGARIAFYAPSTMISMTAYEECLKFYSGVLR